MPDLNFSFSNQKIGDFFEGRSNNRPIAELIYVHTHPKTFNFMSQIEVLVNKTAQYIQENPKKVGAAHQLQALAQQYAEHISDVNEESAAKMLDVLKQIYTICTRYIKVEESQ